MLKYVIAFLILFILGIGTYNVYAQYPSAIQFPLSGREMPSPGDWMNDNNIAMTSRNVLLSIPNATLVVYANTNSMDPVLDETTHGIEMPPVKGKLQVGDIISYRSSAINAIVVHRIASIGEDEHGTYYITQGDNNKESDPEKIRFKNIVGVVVALIY